MSCVLPVLILSFCTSNDFSPTGVALQVTDSNGTVVEVTGIDACPDPEPVSEVHAGIG